MNSGQAGTGREVLSEGRLRRTTQGSNRVESRPHTCTMCQKDVSPGALTQGAITGSVCKDCFYHFRAQSGMPLLDFLDGLDEPVLVVDSDVVVTLANKPLLAVLGKSLSEVRGQRGGDVFECAYARLPEGCGKTVHCSGCAIRRTVTETFITGKSFQGVQAYVNRDMVTQVLKLDLLISTEKVWGMVLLRIDHIGPQQQPWEHGQGH